MTAMTETPCSQCPLRTLPLFLANGKEELSSCSR